MLLNRMDCVITCNIHFVERQFALFFMELYYIYMGNGASMRIFKKVQARLAPLLVFLVNNNNTRDQGVVEKNTRKRERGGRGGGGGERKEKKDQNNKTKNY